MEYEKVVVEMNHYFDTVKSLIREEYIFDDKGRVKRKFNTQIEPDFQDSTVISYEYDKYGNWTQKLRNDDLTVRIINYDDQERPISVFRNGDLFAEIIYEGSSSRIDKISYSEGNWVDYSYDFEGRIVAKFTMKDGTNERIDYYRYHESSVELIMKFMHQTDTTTETIIRYYNQDSTLAKSVEYMHDSSGLVTGITTYYYENGKLSHMNDVLNTQATSGDSYYEYDEEGRISYWKAYTDYGKILTRDWKFTYFPRIE